MSLAFPLRYFYQPQARQIVRNTPGLRPAWPQKPGHPRPSWYGDRCMKRSRVALLLFMATFAGSLLAAGMAGGEGGAAAQPLSGGSASGGYCQFAYDPVDEEPYDSCDLGWLRICRPRSCDLLPRSPQTRPGSDDDSLDYYDADSIDPAGTYQPPKVSASLGQPVYGLPAEDEIPLESDDDSAYTDSESQTRVDAASTPAEQVLNDPFTQERYEYGHCTRHCWPELYGDTDPDADPYAVLEETDSANSVSELLADVERLLDDLAGRPRAVSPAEFVRLETSSDLEDPWSELAAGDEAIDVELRWKSKPWPSGHARFKVGLHGRIGLCGKWRRSIPALSTTCKG